MSYLRITTVVQATPTPDYSGPSQVPTTDGYETTPASVSSREFQLTSTKVQMFPNVTSTSNVRDCIVQLLGDSEAVIYYNDVPVMVVPTSSETNTRGTTAFSPIYGAANQLLYKIAWNGSGTGFVRVTSTTLTGYGAA